MRKSSFNYTLMVLGLLILLITIYTMNSTNEGFYQATGTGMTYVLDETGRVCSGGKKKVGVTGKPMSDSNFLEGISCPAGFTAAYLSYYNSIVASCVKNIQVCDDGYKYNKNVTDGKFCQNIFNSNDRKTTKGGAVCPLPKGDEIRIIDTAYCQIAKKATPTCKTGYTYDNTINKCYQCR
jgi:hypothetical protein